jgi:hypothetical protein
MLDLQLVPASTTNRANSLDSNELVVLQTTGVERNSSDFHLQQTFYRGSTGVPKTVTIERTGPSVGPPDILQVRYHRQQQHNERPIKVQGLNAQ